MFKKFCATVFILMLALSFSTMAFAQDATTQDMKKDEVKKPEMKKEGMKKSEMKMAKDERAMGPLKSVTCDPTCGFMVKSHSEKELISIVKTHAEKMHHMKMADDKIKEMIKTDEEAKE